jgi:drug/metabolite transporter (DMT)-like permease
MPERQTGLVIMQKRAYLAGILFSSIFGFSFMFSKIAMSYVSPVGLIAYRFLVAAVAFEIIRRIGIIPVTIKKSDLQYLLPVAIAQPVLYFLFETYGLRLTSSGEAGMMIALIPVFVTILSGIFLKERPKRMQLVFIALSVAGVILIQVNKAEDGLTFELLGMGLLLLAVISAATFNIVSRRASMVVRPSAITYFMMVTGAVVFNLIYVVQLLVEDRPADYVLNMFHIELVLPILYLGLAASIGGFFLVNFSLSKLPAHVSSIYSNLATIVAIIAGWAILGEPLETYHIVGSAMIIIGVYGTVRLNIRNRARKV